MGLNDDDFDELLQKRLLADDEDDLYLDGDLLEDDDAADLLQMRDAVSSYKAESLDWAERQSATMPVPKVNAAVALWDRAPRWAVAGVAAAACLIGAVTLTHTSAPADTTVAIAAPNAQVLAADNQLLSSVDDALTGSGAAPTEHELGLTAADLSPSAHDAEKHGRSTNSIN